MLVVAAFSDFIFNQMPVIMKLYHMLHTQIVYDQLS